MGVPSKPDAALMTQRLGDVVASGGAAAWGVTDVAPFDVVGTDMAQRKATGGHADLTFTYTDPDTATDVRRTYPWAASLLVVAWAYVPRAGRPGPGAPGTGRIARFATEDHYIELRRILDEACGHLHSEGWRAEHLSDDNRLVDRAAAQRAGVGWWGKSAMILTPKHGPWLLLGSVVTDAELTLSSPMVRDCGTCDACRPACPTGALAEPGVLDARLCLARWLQAKGAFPRELRTAVGDRVYGCDDCLDACPPGKQLMDSAISIVGRVDLIALLDASDDELLDEYGHFYMPKRNPNMIRRNALIALGNTGGAGAVEALARFARHASPNLRAHAVWALGALDTPESKAVIDAVAASERDSQVREEIELIRGHA